MLRNPVSGAYQSVNEVDVQGQRDIGFAELSANGWSIPAPIDCSPSDDSNPSMAFFPDGKVVVTWQRSEAVSTVYYSIGQPGSGNRWQWSDPVRVSDGASDAKFPTVVIDPVKGMLVSFAVTESTGGGWRIIAAMPRSGDKLSPSAFTQVPIGSATGVAAPAPEISLRSGKVWAAWLVSESTMGYSQLAEQWSAPGLEPLGDTHNVDAARQRIQLIVAP
jgi:hypothetical protein